MNIERRLLENIYTGKDYEVDLMGKINIIDARKFMAQVEHLRKEAEDEGIKLNPNKESLPFWKAVRITKENQPDDPVNPSREFPRELRLAFAESLGIEDDDDLDNIGIYTAVGGPLDHHGIDGFIEVKLEGVPERLITFDITKNPKKPDTSRADFIVGGEILDRSDPDFKEEEFLDMVSRYGKEAADIFMEKIDREKMQA